MCFRSVCFSGNIRSDKKDEEQMHPTPQSGLPQTLHQHPSSEPALHPPQQLPPNLQQIHQQMLLEQQLQRQSPQQLQQQLYQQHLLEQVRHQQHLLGQLHQQQALIHAQQQQQMQQQKRESKRESDAEERSPGFDLSAFAGLAVGQPVSEKHHIVNIFTLTNLDGHERSDHSGGPGGQLPHRDRCEHRREHRGQAPGPPRSLRGCLLGLREPRCPGLSRGRPPGTSSVSRPWPASPPDLHPPRSRCSEARCSSPLATPRSPRLLPEVH